MTKPKEYRVGRLRDGWGVFRGDWACSDAITNAEAWRLADRLNSEPISRAEDVSEWMSKKD